MTASHPTIAALLTPLAPGGIAVIGLAGPGVDAILSEVLRRPDGLSPIRFANDRPVFCRLVDGSEILDDAILVRAERGNTINAEISTHGGVRIAQRALDLVARHGAQIVDGLDWQQATAGGDTVEQAVDRALLDASARRLTHWLLSQRQILPAYLEKLDSLGAQELATFRARSQVAIRLLAGMRVALIGPPNAGKSTLANRLIGMDRLIISEQPGTTRDWVSETALIKGWPVILTDTAGIRETTCPIEVEAIRRSGTQARQADVAVIVLDATIPGSQRKLHLDDALSIIPSNHPRIVILNKGDLTGIPPSSQPVNPKQHTNMLLVSALHGQGLETLETQLASLLGLDQLDDCLPTAMRPEQLEATITRKPI